jgi:hypothetical protein
VTRGMGWVVGGRWWGGGGGGRVKTTKTAGEIFLHFADKRID